MAEHVDPRELHRVVATCILYRMQDGEPRFFIKRRSPRPPFPSRWEAGAGGGASPEELDDLPSSPDGQKGVGEHIARLEVMQETGLVIDDPVYLGTFRFRRHDGVLVFGVRYFALVVGGEVALGDGAVEYRWVTAAQSHEFDLIGEAAADIQNIAGAFKDLV